MKIPKDKDWLKSSKKPSYLIKKKILIKFWIAIILAMVISQNAYFSAALGLISILISFTFLYESDQ